MKISVVYYSKTGNTQRIAEVIANAMSEINDVKAQAFRIDAIDEAFLKESNCVILGTPVYMAGVAAVVKTWLEENGKKYELSGKIGGAFATCNYLHGGCELAIQSILAHFMVLGMLTYSGGGAFGAPVIHLGPAALGKQLDDYYDTFTTYGKRMAEKTLELFR